MTRVRLDTVLWSTLFEAYKNYLSTPVIVALSGTLPVSTYQEFTQTISFNRAGTRCDIYYEKTVGYLADTYGKQIANSSSRLTPTSADSITFPIIRYGVGTLTVGVGVVNNVGSETLDDTYAFSIVQYDAPLAF